MRTQAPDHLELYRYPIEPWRFVEREYDSTDLGLTETLFAVGNGYIGMRANGADVVVDDLGELTTSAT